MCTRLYVSTGICVYESMESGLFNRGRLEPVAAEDWNHVSLWRSHLEFLLNSEAVPDITFDQPNNLLDFLSDLFIFFFFFNQKKKFILTCCKIFLNSKMFLFTLLITWGYTVLLKKCNLLFSILHRCLSLYEAPTWPMQEAHIDELTFLHGENHDLLPLPTSPALGTVRPIVREVKVFPLFNFSKKQRHFG